jgi:hypothetical protein
MINGVNLSFTVIYKIHACELGCKKNTLYLCFLFVTRFMQEGTKIYMKILYFFIASKISFDITMENASNSKLFDVDKQEMTINPTL